MRTFCNDIDVNSGSGFISVQNVNTADLVDQTADIDYHICNKMGTSIPTIFARMFLFSSAYTDIYNLEEQMRGNDYPYRGKAHDYVINPDSGEHYVNVYHHLISEHLDMLEFLFFYGNKITVEKWSLDEFKKLIKGENEYDRKQDEGLNRLVDALYSALHNTPCLDGLSELQITLFKYENKLVGGTSPDFIVFTNPNWKAIIQEKGLTFEYELFTSNTHRPLHRRDFKFRKLLTLMAFGGKLDNVDALKKYIIASKTSYDDDIHDWWEQIESQHEEVATEEWIDQEIGKLADPLKWSNQGNTVEIHSPLQDIPLYVAKASQDFHTDYKIAPTRLQSEWETETVNGGEVKLKGAPMLVLAEGIPNADYHEHEPWILSTPIPVYSTICNKYLSQREVPGKCGLKYPILTADDFLEDKIVELAYTVDNSRFFTGCKEDMNYMLPIKKAYFRFFKFENLQNDLKINFERDIEGQITKVLVSLTIPMESKKVGKVTITREYGYENNAIFKIINCKKDKGFDIGVFPFYRVINSNNDVDRLNSYRFMCGYSTTEVECWLGTFDNVGFVVPKDGHEGQNLNFKKRSVRQNYGTAFAERNGSFDYMEVEVTTKDSKDQVKTSGLFFPMMTELAMENAQDNLWYYSVDFGTSNTHIVMAKSTQDVKEAIPFAYGGKSQQMVTLGNIQKPTYNFLKFKNDIIREFVPASIFSGNDESVKFPIRSVVYEKNGAGVNMELFSERNIGFKFKSEQSLEFVGNTYYTDLKWQLRQQQQFKARVDAYCYQIMWMLRNHSLLNGGTEKIQVAVTYPISMRPTQLRTIKDAWRNAWTLLVDSKHNFPERNFYIESAAPYKYSIVKNDDLNRTDAYVNVDIGGGSTDLLYYESGLGGPMTAKSYAYSVFFAANDLWGTGISMINANSKDNGFIINFEKKLAEPLKNELKAYKDVATNASDVVSYLFSNPTKWHFDGSIKSSPIASVVVMHFAATMYYLASIIKKNVELKIPKCINFTGMGSKYLSILSSTNEDLANIIKSVFRNVITDPDPRSKDISKISVTCFRNPKEGNPKEVTALGAIYMLSDSLNQITDMKNPVMKTAYCIDGEESQEERLTYEDDSIEENKPKVDIEIKKFIELLKSPDFCNAVDISGIDYSFDTLVDNGLDWGVLDSSFLTVKQEFDRMSTQERGSKLKDAPFFWPLKDALYTIALRISKNKDLL